MQIAIQRTQSKGFTGGISFEAKVRFIPTAEEAQLINHYGIANEVVSISNKRNIAWGGNRQIKVRDALAGESYKAKNLSELIDWIEVMKEAAQGVVGYIGEARKFKGEEIWEVLLNEDDDE